ncbi:hypothetical protein [Faecalibacter bovis]|uniref:Uncharacterized protein n=1 Tax=Faecalibacter bovis TaxID=2898187 RepID=A0ABX7XFZ8_9FLAO|nr:hypothetical protein [Faecalibacter bovis]MBS7333462.1 hypothetical protein [Weeksellaceae bacterium]QTV06514.1 hypothetical protein J9309_04100 [Faecalibacter bovis]
MINEKLKDLAKKFEAELSHQDIKVSGIVGRYVRISIYRLKIPYKGYEIQVKFELGNHNICEIKTALNQKYIPDFEITSRNHFINLFLGKKNMLIVKSDDTNYEEFLLQSTLNSGLESIAKENSFEPNIYAIKERNIQHLNAEYSLQLKDKIGSLEATIKFYKLIIDNL